MKEVLAQDPQNLPAQQYLELIAQKRELEANHPNEIANVVAMTQVTNAWQSPARPGGWARVCQHEPRAGRLGIHETCHQSE